MVSYLHKINSSKTEFPRVRIRIKANIIAPLRTKRRELEVIIMPETKTDISKTKNKVIIPTKICSIILMTTTKVSPSTVKSTFKCDRSTTAMLLSHQHVATSEKSSTTARKT